MIDRLYQKIRRLYNDFLYFSVFWQFVTIVCLIIVILLILLLVKKYAVWLFLILLIILAIRVYLFGNSHHLFWRDSTRRCVQVILESYVRKGLVLRNIFKLDTFKDQISEKERKPNVAVYELELSRDEVTEDFSSDEILTFEAQDAWNRYLINHAERSAFQIANVSLVDHNSYFLMIIVLKNNRDVNLLDREEVYAKNQKDSDFS